MVARRERGVVESEVHGDKGIAGEGFDVGELGVMRSCTYVSVRILKQSAPPAAYPTTQRDI